MLPISGKTGTFLFIAGRDGLCSFMLFQSWLFLTEILSTLHVNNNRNRGKWYRFSGKVRKTVSYRISKIKTIKLKILGIPRQKFIGTEIPGDKFLTIWVYLVKLTTFLEILAKAISAILLLPLVMSRNLSLREFVVQWKGRQIWLSEIPCDDCWICFVFPVVI